MYHFGGNDVVSLFVEFPTAGHATHVAEVDTVRTAHILFVPMRAQQPTA
jgi:hypothetical protein